VLDDIPSSTVRVQAASAPTAVGQTGPQVRLTPLRQLHPRIQLPRSRRASIQPKTIREHPDLRFTVEGQDTMHEGQAGRRLFLLLVMAALLAMAPLRQVPREVPTHQRQVTVTRPFQPLLNRVRLSFSLSSISSRDTRPPVTHTQVRFSSLLRFSCAPPFSSICHGTSFVSAASNGVRLKSARFAMNSRPSAA
jgi:hypothetical protein